jgi:hypothetical protein
MNRRALFVPWVLVHLADEMIDVEIIYPGEKQAMAGRLRGALVEAGYQVEAKAGVDFLAVPADAKALVIIWDRFSIRLPAMQDVARAARKAGRAIDVSSDGITPIGMPDEARLIQFSGWRGDPHHPGWKRILTELNRLCGQRAPGVAAAEIRAPAAPARRGSAGKGEGHGGTRRRPFLPLIALAGLLAIILVIAGWKSGRFGLVPHPGPSAAPAVARREPPRAALPPRGNRETRESPGLSNPAGGAEPPSPLAAGSAAEEPAARGGGAAGPPAARRGNGSNPSNCGSTSDCAGKPAARTRAAGKGPPGRSARHATRPAIRYTIFSENMRLFCQRAGRRTPECRLFRGQFRHSK